MAEKSFYFCSTSTHIPVFSGAAVWQLIALFSEVAHFWNSLHCGIYNWLLHVAIGTKGVQWMQLVKIGKKKILMQFIIYFTGVVICTPEKL